MQLFGNEGKEENKITIGDHEIKVVKASSLPEGTHPSRFYPLSAHFYQGADYISIVQLVHWLNRQPCICRRTSYDYTVPDTQNKPTIDVSCIVCNDKFAWFKKGKTLKDTNPQEAERLKQIGKDLMEKTSASSLVSFTDMNSNLTFPVLLRYGKELLDQLQIHSKRILDSNGVHLCDPAKGYMFDIIIGKNDGGFRTYKNSMPSVNTQAVDITGAPWKWNEICEAIRSEIMPVLSPEELEKFYFQNYGGAVDQTFHHPAFQQQNNAGNSSQSSSNSFVAPNNNNQQNNAGGFVPPSNNQQSSGNTAVPTFVPPVSDQKKETSVPTFVAPVNNQEKETSVPTFVPPTETKTAEVSNPNTAGVGGIPRVGGKMFPCHAQSEGGSGYDQNDANCKVCQQAESCYKASISKSDDAPQSPVGDEPAFNTGDVQTRLNVLNQKMQNK